MQNKRSIFKKNSPYTLNTIVLPAHAQVRLLYHLKIAIKYLLPIRQPHEQNNNKTTTTTKSIMADSYTTHQEVSHPGLCCSFWKLFCCRRLRRHQCLLENTLNTLAFKKGVLDGFLAVSLLQTESCNLIANCSLLYLNSNGMNSLKSLILKTRSYSYKCNCYKNPQIKLECNWLKICL